MKTLKDFVTTNENGETVFDEAGYNAEMDRIRNEASNTARANAEKSMKKDIEAQVRKEIEENAKLSAEEKLAKEREALINDRKAFNAERFKAHLKSANLFSDEEVDVYMGLMGDNYEESVEKADKVIAARTKYNQDYEKKLKENIQIGTPRANGVGANDNSVDNDIIKRAQKYNDASNAQNARVEIGKPSANRVEIK